MSDDGRRSRAATRSGHDVTGTDINLNFPDSKFGSTARLGSSDVAPDRRPTVTEKQAPTGQLASFGALDTGRFASESWRSRAGRRYTDSTCHDCHCDQQEGGDGPQHCICHRLGTIWFARAAGLTLYWFIHVQQGRDAPKKKKNIFAAEARATMGKSKKDAKR